MKKKRLLAVDPIKFDEYKWVCSRCLRNPSLAEVTHLTYNAPSGCAWRITSREKHSMKPRERERGREWASRYQLSSNYLDLMLGIFYWRKSSNCCRNPVIRQSFLILSSPILVSNFDCELFLIPTPSHPTLGRWNVSKSKMFVYQFNCKEPWQPRQKRPVKHVPKWVLSLGYTIEYDSFVTWMTCWGWCSVEVIRARELK